jgi:CubicO group peptidase (beta-lactamase class C family)
MQAEQQADPDLKAELERLAGKGWHRIAAAVVDLPDSSPVRIAGASAALHSHFEIGSITKAMTGMLLAIALEKNELLLDSTVGDLQPALRNTEVASATMRELCTHSSGLPRLPKDFSGARLVSVHPSAGRAVAVLADKARPLRLGNIALQLLGVRRW